MRLLTTKLHIDQIEKHLPEIVKRLFKAVPTGVGCKGTVKLDIDTFKDICERGAAWCVDNGTLLLATLSTLKITGACKMQTPRLCLRKLFCAGLTSSGH